MEHAGDTLRQLSRVKTGPAETSPKLPIEPQAEAGASAPDVAQSAETARRVSRTRRDTKVELFQRVRENRDAGRQEIGYNSRPFILCGLPIKRPKATVHERHNGKFTLRIVADPQYGLPFGVDRLIPIWVATQAVRQRSRTVQFDSVAEILDTFGLDKGGKTYKRLVEGFKRIFAATMYFTTDDQPKSGVEVFAAGRFHFFDAIKVWFMRGDDSRRLDGFQNTVVLSELFWQDLQKHPIPVDLTAVKALANSPGCLDFFMWVVWRCWTARSEADVPLFGDDGLEGQLGVAGYEGRRFHFRATVRRWMRQTKALWPDCPAALSQDGDRLIVRPSRRALSPRAVPFRGHPES